MEIKDLTVAQLANLYREWRNSYLSMYSIADDKNISYKEASWIVTIGKQCHEAGY